MYPERPPSSPQEAELPAGLRRELGRAVAAVCPRWLADQRDDIAQAAALRILELQRQSEGMRQFSSSYLWRVAHSVLVDDIRRVRRRREQPLEDASPTRQRAVRPPNPEEEAQAQEISEAIGSCLGQLVSPRRLAVTLHLQGHSVPEAAELLGYGRKRTENLVYRGLSDLRRCLASRGLEP
jgi:RNA polymerase sigma-70 factor (ECF subfamily)